MQDGDNKLLVLDGDRVYVPDNMRTKLMRKIHGGHLGFHLCYWSAQKAYFWPAMWEQIKTSILNCPACVAFSKELLMEKFIVDKHASQQVLD